jgi:hypothetical protein
MGAPSSLGVSMGPLESRGFGRVLWFVQPLLWLLALAASTVLVYWLYIDPVYGMHWSSIAGALLFVLLSIYAVANCILSFRAVSWLVRQQECFSPSRSCAKQNFAEYMAVRSVALLLLPLVLLRTTMARAGLARTGWSPGSGLPL